MYAAFVWPFRRKLGKAKMTAYPLPITHIDIRTKFYYVSNIGSEVKDMIKAFTAFW